MVNARVSKRLRREVDNLVPLTNVVGRNIYRHAKRAWSRHEGPVDIDPIINRYEQFHEAMENNKKQKLIKELQLAEKKANIL